MYKCTLTQVKTSGDGNGGDNDDNDCSGHCCQDFKEECSDKTLCGKIYKTPYCINSQTFMFGLWQDNYNPEVQNLLFID